MASGVASLQSPRAPRTAVHASSGPARSPYIAGPRYDKVFFIFSPLLALFLGIVASFTPLAEEKYVLNGYSESWLSLFSGIFTMAHLFIVFFRSHLNPSIFKSHRIRFTLAPALLFGAMMLSSWMLIFVFVLAVWWDVYHSSLQTFGLGRIYDAKAGNDPREGRDLDRGINLLLYLGPILAGASLMEHVRHFDRFKEVGTAFFSYVPVYAQSHRNFLAWGVLAFGLPYLAYYLYAYYRLMRGGYRVSRQKVLLLFSTGLCSVYAWGFNPFGQAFFIMNFFHALQYFALVWWTEKGRMASFFRLGNLRWRTPATLILFIAIGFLYGLWAKIWGESSHLAFSVLLTVSIMHFWYDGFIWSVRRRQVE